MRSFGVFYAFLGMPPEFYTSKAAARRTSHLCTVSQQITFGLQRLTLPPPRCCLIAGCFFFPFNLLGLCMRERRLGAFRGRV